MSRILYITNARIPTEKAHGYQICKMCEAFADLGLDVELIAPTRKNNITEDLFVFYNIKKRFRITYVKTFDFIRWAKYLKSIASYLQSYFFLKKLKQLSIKDDSVVITRNPEVVWQMKKKSVRKVYFSAHNLPKSKLGVFIKLLRNVDGIICNSQGTASGYHKLGFLNTIVAPNAVDLRKFNINSSSDELREKFSIDKTKKVITYVGHFYKWKGVDVVIECAKLCHNKADYIFLLVGGLPVDIKKYQSIVKVNKIINIKFLGFQKNENIPQILKMSDVLLLPNVPVNKESSEYTSPIKMFEYMASRRPIIASDLPSMREILNENNCVFIKPGDASEMKKMIKILLEDEGLRQKISERAYKDVQQYTWEKRAGKIISYIK